jgi:hypothetical protein
MKPNHFFRYNILIDIILLMAYFIGYVTFCAFPKRFFEMDFNPFPLIICFPIVFVVHSLVVFLLSFRYKEIKLWKVILYCVILFSFASIVYFCATCVLYILLMTDTILK